MTTVKEYLKKKNSPFSSKEAYDEWFKNDIAKAMKRKLKLEKTGI